MFPPCMVVLVNDDCITSFTCTSWAAKMVGLAHGESKVRSGHACLVVVLCFGASVILGTVVVPSTDIVIPETKESWCDIAGDD
jgi:hypothetical protein